MQRIRVVDSHTAGEATRVVVEGSPPLDTGSMAERRRLFEEHFDIFRRSVILEPRGTEGMVGALLLTPEDPAAAAGVIFFNNRGCLGMCGHGAMGVVTTLAHLGRIDAGDHTIETPVGTITARLHRDGQVTIENVPARRTASAIRLEVPGAGAVCGDVAWGGNWFYITESCPILLKRSSIPELVDYSTRVWRALAAAGITGDDGAEIDHVELTAPPIDPANSGRNFVLCPGLAWDRSPCGTGTSAHLACLFADRRLQEGEPWRQEGILGTVFEATARAVPGGVVPSITGRAHITGEGELLVSPDDPFAYGIDLAREL
ncbi:MAG: proline racemase family protein [Armatimonadetes bacterium]|nr:proline racemase family protein [Armatimonadota bacterium]MDE2207698.1 proline racemase family protein [Armatimonadota bacterium]